MVRLGGTSIFLKSYIKTVKCFCAQLGTRWRGIQATVTKQILLKTHMFQTSDQDKREQVLEPSLEAQGY